jgi:glycosyltransferase involved in cell wall biosynthesis
MTIPAEPEISYRRRVLAVGPGEGLLTGQSMAFLTYVRNSHHMISIVNTNDVGMSLIGHAISSIRVIILSAWHLLCSKPQCVYISTSRSKLGAIKDIAVIAIARLRGVPVVNHLHGITFRNFRDSLGTIYGSIVDWAYGYIAASIVLHEDLISQYARYSRMKVAVVNNFVSAEIARALESKKEIAGALNILFLSNVIPEKGVFELIDAVKGLLAHGPHELHLRIAGHCLPGAAMTSKEVKAKLSASIAGVAQIQYCGFADAAERRALLEWANVLALPSYMKEEAIPLAVLEGMAAGCHLIVSDFGILSGLVTGLVATVVPAKDANALQEAIAAILANAKLLQDAFSVNPRIARERYSEAQYIRGIDGIIDQFSGK